MTISLDLLYKLGPLLTFASALIAAGIAWNFGRIQAGIAKQQAATATGAATTARNKLRLELFARRLEIYDIVTAHMEAAHARDMWKVDASPYFRAVSGSKWLFDRTVSDWIYDELQTIVRAVATAQAACEGVEPGPERAAKSMAVMAAITELDAQFVRRDEVFGPFLHMKDA